MSLIVGMLGFPDLEYAVGVRVGVIFGSLLSALTGYLVLRHSLSRRASETQEMQA